MDLGYDIAIITAGIEAFTQLVPQRSAVGADDRAHGKRAETERKLIERP